MQDRLYRITVKAWFVLEYGEGRKQTFQRSLTQRADTQKVDAVYNERGIREAMIQTAVKAMSGKLEFENGCEALEPTHAVLEVTQVFF